MCYVINGQFVCVDDITFMDVINMGNWWQSVTSAIAAAQAAATSTINKLSQVSKSYSETIPCSKTAQGVISQIESNFSAYGDYGIPNVDFETVTFNPPLGPLTAGESIPITLQVGYTLPDLGLAYDLNTSVTVSSVQSTSFSFQTVPGHLLFPASITFSATDVGNGSITFNISISGTLPNIFNGGLFFFGGSQFEDNQWNNFLQVKTLCDTP